MQVKKTIDLGIRYGKIDRSASGGLITHRERRHSDRLLATNISEPKTGVWIMPEMKKKICSRCRERKILTEFNRNKRALNGLRSECKKCERKYYEGRREARLISMRKYAENHKEEKRALGRKYYEAHKDDWRKWRRKHRETERARHKKYRERHQDYCIELGQKRRHQIRDLPFTLTKVEWDRILDRNSHRCHYCGRIGKSDNPLEKEHRVPVSKGGGFTAQNIVPACRDCNRKKHTMTDKEFKKRLNAEAQLRLTF